MISGDGQRGATRIGSTGDALLVEAAVENKGAGPICGWRVKAEYGGGSRCGVPSGLLPTDGRDAGGTAGLGSSSTLGLEYCIVKADDRLSSFRTLDAIGGAPGEAAGLLMNRGGTYGMSGYCHHDHAHFYRRRRGVFPRVLHLSRRKASQKC